MLVMNTAKRVEMPIANQHQTPTQTEPIIDYYKAHGLVVTISAVGKVEDVTTCVMEALKPDEDDK